MSKIQANLMKSSMMNAKMNNSQIAKIENEIMQKVKAQEQVKEAQLKQVKDYYGKQSSFKKLFDYNRPRINIAIGLVISIIQGGFMPLIGAIMAKMLFVLMEVKDLDKMRDQSNQWCLLMFIFAACSFLTGFIQKFSFGVIGENVAFNIRKKLYRKVMEKHQGFFDRQENSPSILTSTLSNDA